MITQTVTTIGDLRKALEHLPDSAWIHSEDGAGLTLHYNNEPTVLFNIGDIPDDDD